MSSITLSGQSKRVGCCESGLSCSQTGNWHQLTWIDHFEFVYASVTSCCLCGCRSYKCNQLHYWELLLQYIQLGNSEIHLVTRCDQNNCDDNDLWFCCTQCKTTLFESKSCCKCTKLKTSSGSSAWTCMCSMTSILLHLHYIYDFGGG